ncbi:MAG: hypothetical protein AAF512_05300, partial [Pseudomonadota bacterium]
MSTNTQSKPIGSITLVVNTPAQAEANDGSVRTLRAGDNVYETDTVSTTSRGLAKLQLSDGTVIQLGPN